MALAKPPLRLPIKRILFQEPKEALVSPSVRDKVMVITGASSGIGRATARLFSAEGARLALIARSGDKLTTLAKEIGDEPLIAATDLTRPGAVETALGAIEQRFGRIDILFANAGSYAAGDAAQRPGALPPMALTETWSRSARPPAIEEAVPRETAAVVLRGPARE